MGSPPRERGSTPDHQLQRRAARVSPA